MTSLRQQTKVKFTEMWTRIPFQGDINSQKDVKTYLDSYYNEAEEIYKTYQTLTNE